MKLVKEPPKDVVGTVQSIDWITPTVFRFRFSLSPNVTPLPGQFISIVIPGAGPGGRDLRRAYSIASPPESEVYELCIRKVEGGPGTSYLSAMKPGSTFKGNAPFGDFHYKPQPERAVCFVATGTGIAPFHAIAHSRLFKEQPPKRAVCLFGSTDQKELIYSEIMAKQSSLEWVPCLSRADESWSGFRGRVSQYLRQLPSDFAWEATDFYLCGNGAMIDEVKKFLMEEKGLPKTAIHQEVYYKPKNEA